jgi:hypothetical protein
MDELFVLVLLICKLLFQHLAVTISVQNINARWFDMR